MAEIKIEKKKPVWPWILLALVVAGILYFIYASQKNDDYTDDADPNEIENMNGVMDSDSLSYDSTIYEDSSNEPRELSEVMRDSSRFGIDTTYTNRALSDLVERTLKMAKIRNLQSSPAVSNLEQYTTSTQNSKITSSSKNFKTVSTDIVEVIEALQSNNAPQMQQKVEALKYTASRINAATDLSKQQSAVQAFFRKAHELLNNLNS